MRPRLLDLFCGAGGTAVGYHRAGFDVYGVDHKRQPHYPFEYTQEDALAFLDRGGAIGFDVIHASPPCQAFTRAQNARGRAHLHPDLVTPVRVLLLNIGLPYIIENVPGAPLRDPVTVCGTAFGLGDDGFELRRHRLFESSAPLVGTSCNHQLPAIAVFGHSPNADFYRRNGRAPGADSKRRAMGIDWMNRNELSEAVPPAFAEFVGNQMVAALATPLAA